MTTPLEKIFEAGAKMSKDIELPESKNDESYEQVVGFLGELAVIIAKRIDSLLKK